MTTAIHPNISLPEGTDQDPANETSKPRSPSNRFTSLFRWGSASEQGNGPELLTAQIDQGSSPSLSPKTTNLPSLIPTNTKFIPPAIDVPLANAVPPTPGMFSDSDNLFLPSTPALLSIDAIEQEVRDVSADLAASIRREMDLEDLIERLQAEAAERGGNGRRTSDYFSDAGTPVRILDADNKDPDVEKLVRKVEQQKAQLRLDMLGKVQEERDKRRAVELQVKELEEIVAKSSTGSRLAPPDSPARVKDLEMALEEAKRKLAEERLMKENFEDLLTALKAELEANRNERDNLRDEVVPQLRARVEGLETEASDMQKLMYEHSRMQQELTSLKTENTSLAAAIKEKSRAQAENLAEAQGQSVSGTPSGYATPGTPTTNVGISLPLNPKDRESLAERLKDVEAQRDALHKALKSLRERQQIEAKKSRERIKSLETERDQALNPSLRKQGRNKEVSALRREVGRLRQRADDAIEQKYMCERSLGTLKMDLEKAEQETCTLRALLQEHDDLIAQHDELKDAHTRLTSAEVERDTAVVEAEAYRKHAESLQRSETMHLQEERNLATQLRITSERVQELAIQVQAQIASNSTLRDRLADCIERGETEQRASAKKINDLQDMLRKLEDKVLEAQQQAEDAVTQHEDEIKRIKETHTSQLRRLKASTVKSPTSRATTSPLLRSPKLEWTRVRRLSASDASKTESLEKRVSELERALADADDEMAEVVNRMNAAQIEVLELQSER
ncbi:hypothetical protein BDD12DRAFT_756588 [Trichophaea hybrida]|nr:hypothetical protein BDD12DRAFT_756588 [Trichophaea hybrida]